MLARGFPVTARSQHGAMPLHWAAFHGNSQMLRDVLERKPPLDAVDQDFKGNATGWLIHGALGGWPGISTAITAIARACCWMPAPRSTKHRCRPATMLGRSVARALVSE
jgi:ankyrin repeat protein